MRILAALNTTISESVGWALIHSMWQGALISVALFAAVKLTTSARLRYFAGLLAMISMLGAFTTTLVVNLPDQSTHTPVAVSMAPAEAAIVTGTSLARSGQASSDSLVPYLSLLWAAGVCTCHFWQLAGLLSMRRLRHRGVWAVPERWIEELNKLRKELRVSRPVLLLESLLVDAPVVLGHLRPLILLPVGLLTNLSSSQIEAILLHELAHVRRCDYLVNLFQRWIEGLFFYHPAIWWISRLIRAERENCCDDVAVLVSGDPHAYVHALAALEENRFQNRAPALAAAGGSLVGRIHRILHRHQAPSIWGMISAATMIAATAVLVVAGWHASAMANQAPVREPQSPERTAPHPAQNASAVKMAQAQEPISRPKLATRTQMSPFEKWLNEDVVYIITRDEQTAFQRLTTDEERQTFIEQFWLRRDPAPDTAVNEMKTEHYRRIAYVNERFASPSKAGWRSDRGRIYIVRGPPAEIESHPASAGTAVPYEIWFYPSVKIARETVSFTFIDSRRTGDYELASPNASNGHPGFTRLVRWTVTDPMNRLVTGLDKPQFELRENGLTRSITYFAGPESPISIAVVAQTSMPELSSLAPAAYVIQTRAVEDAIRQLEASGNSRKALIIASAGNDLKIPGGIVAVRTDSSMIRKWVVEVSNQYVAGFMSETPDALVEISVEQVRGLPTLKVNPSGY